MNGYGIDSGANAMSSSAGPWASVATIVVGPMPNRPETRLDRERRAEGAEAADREHHTDHAR